MAVILYSFRRCPYAIRARFCLALLGVRVQLREVVLKNKPEALLALGGRSTVPQLLNDDERYPESLDIIFWALRNSTNNALAEQLWPTNQITQAKIMAWVTYNDGRFKSCLDRYKYADRYPEHPETFYREKAEVFLRRLDRRLSRRAYLMGEQMTLADIAIFPFIRQFAGVNRVWFDNSPYLHVQRWLAGFIEGDEFARVMQKLPAWEASQPIVYFP